MALGAASLAPGPTLSGASSVTMPLASPVGGDARPPAAPATYPLPANAPEPRPTAVEVLARRCDDLEYFLTMENLNIHRQQVILNKLWETFGLLHPQIHTPEMEQTLHILSTVLGLAPPSPGSLLPPTSSPYVPLVPTFSPYDPYPLSAYPQAPSSAAPVPLPAVAPSAHPPRPLSSPCPSRTPPAPAPPTRPPRLLPSWTPSQTKTAATTGNWPTLKTNTEEMETTRKVRAHATRSWGWGLTGHSI
ncbi:unnamed protein product [Cyprideis torosa]|uniref:Uncharacterized protein n=1 Tax=Cyprideis torosa TaxID=163714 RepID=A0A7R8ZS60_9CRUS|nr:unnamed protein product [Cyprideis torosa]CAG0900807.1 unnamed protein product [Cyprideis torosa]